MKKLFISLLLLGPLGIACTCHAQPKPVVINGKITSFEESLPLEGACIQVKNSNNGTGTQADGSFSLSVLPGEKVLVVSLQGYEKKEIPITQAREYDIVLKRTGNIHAGIRNSPSPALGANLKLKNAIHHVQGKPLPGFVVKEAVTLGS